MYTVATPLILIHLGKKLSDFAKRTNYIDSFNFKKPFCFTQVSYAPQVQSEEVDTYEGAQVWRTTLLTSSDILLMKKLIDDQDISIWSLTPNHADFLVKSEEKLKVNRLLNSQNMNHTVVVMDVQRRVDAQRSEPVLWNDKTLRVGHRLNWNEYPTLEIIDEYLDYLKENFASICEVITIGYTAKNRTIKMVKISNGNPQNKAILIASGLHAREWIAVTSALYVLDSIISKFDQLPRYMKNKEWIIIPLLNPDGFQYSQTHDRLWRKNRRQFSDCKGVDINRNFQVDWDIPGITVKDECSESYSGPHPFSEAESMALRDTVLNSNKKPEAFIDLHSYGRLILYPWSAKSVLIDDKNVHRTNAEKISNAIYNSTGQMYKPGVTYHTIYPTTGAAIDWAYSLGIPQSFAIEAGDDGLYGFLLPTDQIENTGKEIFAAFKALAKVIDPDFIHRGRDYDAWF